MDTIFAIDSYLFEFMLGIVIGLFAVFGKLVGYSSTLDNFRESRYGSAGRLAEKRRARNPLDRQHDFRACPDLREFFDFIDDPANGQRGYPDRLPWED